MVWLKALHRAELKGKPEVIYSCGLEKIYLCHIQEMNQWSRNKLCWAHVFASVYSSELHNTEEVFGPAPIDKTVFWAYAGPRLGLLMIMKYVS